MSQIIDFTQGRLLLAVKRGFRNWKSYFKEDFSHDTRLSSVSFKTLCHLAEGRGKATFYIYDLVMNVNELGSGFQFNELTPKNKMKVIDQYLFVLDQIRFELMKRCGWLLSYPAEGFSLVELIADFTELAPNLQAKVPSLSPNHPGYVEYQGLNTLDREAYIRRLIPEILKEIKD